MSAPSPATVAERLALPLDWCRRSWFRWLLRSDFLRATVLSRDRRIATAACANVLVSAVGAVYLPILYFTLGPVLLGVAHVAADVRYLVLRGQLTRGWKNVVWLGCLTLFGLRAALELRLLRHVESLELGVAAALTGAGLFAGARQGGSGLRAAGGAGIVVVLATAAHNYPRVASLALVHVHNLVGVAAWALLFRVSKRWLVWPLSLLVGATVLLGSGALFQVTLASPFVSSFNLHVLTLASWVAPFTNVKIAVGVTTAFVFLQAVHYSVWLSWIPQEQQGGRGTPTYRMSVRALFADLGTGGVVAVATAAVAVLVGACFQLQRARSLYMSLATFHGYLELALLAYFWARRAGPATPKVAWPSMRAPA